MLLWLAAVGALIGLLVALALLLLLPVSLTSNLQARAEPSGGWALAVGFGFGPLAVSAVAAAAVPAFVTCHLYGRQLLRVPLKRRPRRKPESSAPGAQASHALGRFVRSLDPVEVALAWWEQERVLAVDALLVDLDYSFRDVALTGRILAALYMLSALLPEHCQINQTPSWASEDRAELIVDGRFRIWLGRLVLAGTRFVLKHRRRMRATQQAGSE